MSRLIDKPIDEVVAIFNSKLWVNNNNSFLGRVFRTERTDTYPVKIEPIYYEGTENYKIDPLKNDNYDAQCFFDVLPELDLKTNEANVRCLFMVSLDALYPNTNRTEATNLVYLDVFNILCRYTFDRDKFISGYKAFEDYVWDEAVRADFDNFYLFRFDLKFYFSNC